MALGGVSCVVLIYVSFFGGIVNYCDGSCFRFFREFLFAE